MGRPIGLSDIESYIIANGKEQTVFYSKKQDRQLTALASSHKRKIITERVVSVEGGKIPVAISLTKVTLC